MRRVRKKNKKINKKNRIKTKKPEKMNNQVKQDRNRMMIKIINKTMISQ